MAGPGTPKCFLEVLSRSVGHIGARRSRARCGFSSIERQRGNAPMKKDHRTGRSIAGGGDQEAREDKGEESPAAPQGRKTTHKEVQEGKDPGMSNDSSRARPFDVMEELPFLIICVSPPVPPCESRLRPLADRRSSSWPPCVGQPSKSVSVRAMVGCSSLCDADPRYLTDPLYLRTDSTSLSIES